MVISGLFVIPKTYYFSENVGTNLIKAVFKACLAVGSTVVLRLERHKEILVFI